MTSHVAARALAFAALQKRFGREPFIGEVKALTGIGCLETHYGDGWKGAGKGSNNIGACQCGKGWKGARFSYTDTHPLPDGTSTTYRVDFRAYPTPLDGWVDLTSVAFAGPRACVREAALLQDWYGVSKAMRQTGYYEGFGKTQEERIANHYRSLARSIKAADAEVAPVVVVPSLPDTVRFGATGESVKVLQRELRLAADGIFGRQTQAALREYQSAHGLDVDGVAGPKTWTTLFGDDYRP